MKTRLESRGFTLIEVLVVLAIVGILSAVLYANFGEARQSSKNQALRSEMKEVQLAIELYKAQYGRYPEAQDLSVAGCSNNTTIASAGVNSASSVSCNVAVNPYIVGLLPDYIAELPSHRDSGNSACDLIYQVEDSIGDRYKLTAANCYAGATSPASGIQQDDELARCPSACPSSGACDPADPTFYSSFAVYSAGAECW